MSTHQINLQLENLTQPLEAPALVLTILQIIYQIQSRNDTIKFNDTLFKEWGPLLQQPHLLEEVQTQKETCLQQNHNIMLENNVLKEQKKELELKYIDLQEKLINENSNILDLSVNFLNQSGENILATHKLQNQIYKLQMDLIHKETHLSQLQNDIKELNSRQKENELKNKTKAIEELNKSLKAEERYRKLLQAQCNIDNKLLLSASQGCDLEKVKLLVDHGASIYERDDTPAGHSSLHLAVINGCYNLVEWITRSRTVVNIKNKKSETALFLASAAGDAKMVRLLLESGADVNARDSNLWAPIHISSAYGYIEVVKVLCEYGANLNVQQGTNGGTPLIEAVYYGHYDIVKLLIEKGADINIGNRSGNTPKQIAVQRGYNNIAQLL